MFIVPLGVYQNKKGEVGTKDLYYENTIKYQSLIKDLSSGEIVEFLIALNM